MQKNHPLKITTVVTDLLLNITKSTKRDLVGRNFVDLLSSKTKETEERILNLKKWAVTQEELLLSIDEKPKRYSVVIRKGTTKYTIVLIEIETVYDLLENVALYRQYAFTDNLTGALTRHGYWNELFELLRYAEKLDYNIGIIFADVDNLKGMNSTYGYQGGDVQIAEASNSICDSLRKHDVLVRLGGDEFLVLLPIRQNNTNVLETVSKRILANIRKNPNMKTTVSLGSQLLTPTQITDILNSKDIKKEWEKYLVIVDQKLKKAKLTGKNQSVI